MHSMHAEPKKMSNRTIKLELTIRSCFVSTIQPFLVSFMETDPKVKMVIYSNIRASLNNIHEACKRAAKDVRGPEGITSLQNRFTRADFRREVYSPESLQSRSCLSVAKRCRILATMNRTSAGFDYPFLCYLLQKGLAPSLSEKKKDDGRLWRDNS
jgi:hypothetical protein